MTFPRWRPITKRTLDLFGRWGDSRNQLRGMLDHALPVVVVDTFRDDDEGSVYGIHAFGSSLAAVAFPSVSFGSAVNDWELLAVTSLSYSGLALPATIGIHMFTPVFPYNPALNPSPAFFHPAALINNRAFTLGTVTGLGGNNPLFPPQAGPSLMPFARAVGDLDFGFPFAFDPPIRVYRDTTLTFQWFGFPANAGLSIFVDILYRERPKVSPGGVP